VLSLLGETVFGVAGDVEATAKKCKEAVSCGDCISQPDCAWCSDPTFANNTNLLEPRCDLPANLVTRRCKAENIENPNSTIEATRDEPLSEVNEEKVGQATQIKPQRINIRARAGQKIQVNLEFKQAEDYPVDLYYLLDLSQSMSDDLEKLQKLGKKLGEEMKNITRDFRLGFGSFVDKTVMPYISTVPKKIKNPCKEHQPCAPSYAFHNDLALSNKTSKFTEAVQRVEYSSNQDNPEGSLDAMMQSIVCKDQIGWRDSSTHLLLLSTDANFHYAGDGKLGGIVLPNDGECHLDDKGYSYTMANEQDYPSIGHLVQKISEHSIQPIFAVTQPVKETYDKFSKMIPKSVVSVLTSDSSNIITLIKQAYTDLKEKVILNVDDNSVKKLENVIISDHQSKCPNGITKSGVLECADMSLGKNATFSFSVQLEFEKDTCLAPITLTVYPEGHKDYQSEIIITPICDCDCDVVADKDEKCSGNGDFQCGACLCESPFQGSNCDCDPAKSDPALELNCYENATRVGLPCSSRGDCFCGVCICNGKEDRVYDGEFCQCDQKSCPQTNGQVCNGQGKCKCNECECEAGWTGKKCDCTTDVDKCIMAGDPDDMQCHGNGKCECNKCVCGVDATGSLYRGLHCENNPTSSCVAHKKCIECKVFQRGEYNTTELCDQECSEYSLKKLEKNEAYSFTEFCSLIDKDEACVRRVFYHESGKKVALEYRDESQCQEYVNPVILVIGVIAAIVGIGIAALLVWKVYTSMKDAREYNQFIQESQNVKFEGGQNPIYKQATSTFQNPTFTQGKPSSNL